MLLLFGVGGVGVIVIRCEIYHCVLRTCSTCLQLQSAQTMNFIQKNVMRLQFSLPEDNASFTMLRMPWEVIIPLWLNPNPRFLFRQETHQNTYIKYNQTEIEFYLLKKTMLQTPTRTHIRLHLQWHPLWQPALRSANPGPYASDNSFNDNLNQKKTTTCVTTARSWICQPWPLHQTTLPTTPCVTSRSWICEPWPLLHNFLNPGSGGNQPSLSLETDQQNSPGERLTAGKRSEGKKTKTRNPSKKLKESKP